MEYETNNRLFTAYDGRILLRTDIDRPVKTEGKRFEYVGTLTNACEEFAAQKLFLKLSEVYRTEVENGVKFVPYSYSVKMQNTYSNEVYLSLLIIATVRRGSEIFSAECRSVIFKNDLILPQKYIARSNKSGGALLLDADGKPSWATLVNNIIKIERAEKCHFPI